MNILIYFSKPLNPRSGGTERVAFILSEYLRDNGHNVTELACIASDFDTSSNHRVFLPDSIEGATKRNIEFVCDFITKEKIDVIINESANSDAIFLFSHQHIPNHVKIISHLHFDISGDLSSFYRNLDLPLKGVEVTTFFRNVLKWCKSPYNKWHAKRWKKTRYQYMWSQSDTIVVLTPRHVHDFNNLIGSEGSEKVISVTNPLSFSTDDMKETAKENILLYVGRLDYLKRIDRILKVWKNVSKTHPFWSLVIVGGGPDEKRLKALSLRMNLQRVSFVGQTNPQPYYSRAKMLLLTSNHEGTPMVVSEAMAYGVVPVVMNTFPGAESMISNGVDGILTAPFNIKMMNDAVSGLMNDNNRWHEMSRAGKQRIKSLRNSDLLSKWTSIIQ